MIVIDASVLIAVFLVPDVHHAVSRAWFGQQVTAGATFAAPMLLLTELAGAISRRTGDPALGRAAVAWFTQLPESHFFPVDDPLWQQATEFAAALGLRGADAVYVALAAQLQIPLLTWDREQRERSAQHIDAREPS